MNSCNFKNLEVSEEQQNSYSSASPFPHIFIDDFLTNDRYSELAEQFPGVTDTTWYKFRSAMENNKRNSTDLESLPSCFQEVMRDFNGSEFIKYLEEMTGITGLIPDPEFLGGGLHKTGIGGKLGMHIDYNLHPTLKLDRRLNAILYLNDYWEDSWGGSLEFWNENVTECVTKISNKGNRLVIFNTDERSWHGHPNPLACPEDVYRHSIAFYYYTEGRPANEVAPEHNTIFRLRPGEVLKHTVYDRLLLLIPSFVRNFLRKVKGML